MADQDCWILSGSFTRLTPPPPPSSYFLSPQVSLPSPWASLILQRFLSTNSSVIFFRMGVWEQIFVSRLSIWERANSDELVCICFSRGCLPCNIFIEFCRYWRLFDYGCPGGESMATSFSPNMTRETGGVRERVAECASLWSRPNASPGTQHRLTQPPNLYSNLANIEILGWRARRFL